MAMRWSVRWTLKVSRRTDQELRAYLGQAGSRGEALSRFIEQSVRARLSTVAPAQKTSAGATAKARADTRNRFADALREVRERTRALSQAQMEKLATEAVAYARKRR